jgi:hypothetical protein
MKLEIEKEQAEIEQERIENEQRAKKASHAL